MDKTDSFNFRRGRGIVWVCDIENSSRYLNDPVHVDHLENFLTRFHWFSRRIVKAADGEYIKWTGDGFLAWFECPIKRDLKSISDIVFEAAWTTTFITNITQMALESNIRISVRNAMTFEEDALITDIDVGGNKSIDLLGRAVVLCFRLSSINSDFPNIIAQKELIFEDGTKYLPNPTKIDFSEKEIDKYFKGEKWNTENIYRSEFFLGLRAKIKKRHDIDFNFDEVEPSRFSVNIQKEMLNGPEWTQKLFQQYIDFLRIDMYENLLKASNTDN